jgi:hypothetical protein
MIREGGGKRLIAGSGSSNWCTVAWGGSWILDHHDLSGIYLFHLMTGPRGNSQPTGAILGTTDRDACNFETLSPTLGCLGLREIPVRSKGAFRSPSLFSCSLATAGSGHPNQTFVCKRKVAIYNKSSGFGRLSGLLSRAFDLTLPNRIGRSSAGATRFAQL